MSVFPVPKLSVVNNNHLFFRFAVLSWDCEWEIVFFSNPAGSGSSVSPTFCLCTEQFIIHFSCLFCCTSSYSAKRNRCTLNTLPGNHLAKVHNIITESLQHGSIFPTWATCFLGIFPASTHRRFPYPFPVLPKSLFTVFSICPRCYFPNPGPQASYVCYSDTSLPCTHVWICQFGCVSNYPPKCVA